jgi:hypothetical protein
MILTKGKVKQKQNNAERNTVQGKEKVMRRHQKRKIQTLKDFFSIFSLVN